MKQKLFFTRSIRVRLKFKELPSIPKNLHLHFVDKHLILHFKISTTGKRLYKLAISRKDGRSSENTKYVDDEFLCLLFVKYLSWTKLCKAILMYHNKLEFSISSPIILGFAWLFSTKARIRSLEGSFWASNVFFTMTLQSQIITI